MSRPNARQRRLRKLLDELLARCRLRGITSYSLRQHVHDSFCSGVHVDEPLYELRQQYADETSSAGLAAQLAHLLEVWGEKKLRATIEKTGGVLDALAVATSSTPEELDKDIGLENINADGEIVW